MTPGPIVPARGAHARARRYDVAIVGGGVVGAATARAVARRGRSVLLLERGELATARGSSRGTARIWHLSGYPTDEYLERGIRAMAGWRELERETGTTLLLDTGGGLSRQGGAQHQAELLDSAGRDTQLLSAHDIQRQWPAIRIPGNGPVLHQRDAGVILARDALAALLASAENSGARLLSHATVRALEPDSEGVRIDSDAGPLRAACVVVAAGPWSRNLLASAGVELDVEVTEQTVAWFPWTGPPPPTLIEYNQPGPYAQLDPARGLKAALHAPGRPITDPDEPEGAGQNQDIKRITEWVAQRFTTAGAAPVHVETCRYTWTRNEQFTLERHGPIIIGSACSGRGFHLAPQTADLLADLAA
jgi:sarcosine oxidase